MHCKFFQRRQIHTLECYSSEIIWVSFAIKKEGIAAWRCAEAAMLRREENPTRRGKHASTSGWLGQNHYWRKQTALRLPTYTPKTPFSNFSSSLLPKNCTYSTPYSGYLQAKIQLKLCTNKRIFPFSGICIAFLENFPPKLLIRQKVASKTPLPCLITDFTPTDFLLLLPLSTRITSRKRWKEY